MTRFRATGLVAALGLFAATAYINYVSLVDAYGSGPPYYGRTTNMDKWSSPLWGLLMIDGVVLLMVLAAVQLFLRRQAETRALEEVPEPKLDQDSDTEDSDGDPPRSGEAQNIFAEKIGKKLTHRSRP